MTATTVAVSEDVNDFQKTGIIAATPVVVVRIAITGVALQTNNHVAAMTKQSSSSSAFTLVKKNMRDTTFVKDRGKPRVAIRSCKAGLRHDDGGYRRCGGEAWSWRKHGRPKPVAGKGEIEIEVVTWRSEGQNDEKKDGGI